MSKKENITLKDIEQRKKRIETELEQIQNKFTDGTTHKFRESFYSRLNPADKIRESPFIYAGLALAAGFIAGLARSGKKGKEEKKQETKNRENGSVRVSNIVMNELKRTVAKKAVHYFVDTLDDALSKQLNRPSPEIKEPKK